ncbi:MAG: DUF2892 domain-containing protein [Anaerolineaceae bacterium]|nr:DUF2892 domain-containing protein [Anaerolineaceae bacterium]
MKTNESSMDRYIRVILGVVLVVLGLLGVVSGTLAIVFYAIGAIAIITGLVGFCPLYAVFKFRTNK